MWGIQGALGDAAGIRVCMELKARPTGQATHLVDDIDAGPSLVVLHQHGHDVISTNDYRHHQGGSPILDIELNCAFNE